MNNKKISEFVTHLLNNPNLNTEPPLIAEGVVINFIVQNITQLQSTLSSPQFFPDLPPKQVLNMILDDLKKRTVEYITPNIDNFIGSIDFTILSKDNPRQTFDNNFYAQSFKNFIITAFENKDVRYNFHSVYNIFSNNILEKYLNEAFKRRSPLFFELTRVAQKNYSFEEYVNYLKVLLIVRSAAYVKKPIEGMTEGNVSIVDFLKIPKTLDQYFVSKTADMYKDLPGVPAELVLSALKSNVGLSDMPLADTPAKFAYILCSRFQVYKQNMTVERGAESPDKSWFGTARKNASFYNFDKRILEDLYIIAGDNNW
ncbi:MAG: hypothetical protein JW982_14430 [Spirochaetes bacterium]|nr:hypothetical protein [Spirochaetota bacterium]